MYLVEKIEYSTRVNEHPRAANEASNGTGPPQDAAAGGRLFLPAPAKRAYRSWDVLGDQRTPEAPRGQQRRGCSDLNV